MLGLSSVAGSVVGGLATTFVSAAHRTWVNGEIVTAALMNTHVRDILTLYKTPFNDSGKLVALSSTYVAELSGENIAGLIKLGEANEISAGKQNFTGGSTTRVVLPVGADLFDGIAGNKTAGSVWVEGDYLHHVSDAKIEWRYLGTLVGTPGGGALPGSVWFESAEWHYIDADSDERYVPGITTSMHSDAAAVAGSAWVETYLHFISGAGTAEEQCHADVAHSDGTDHGDVAHVDTHSDSHTNSHSDVSHSDSHGDSHTDSHGDSYVDHDDYVHVDQHINSHSDVAHDDSYSDTAHSDSHGDSHSDTHDDSHTDHSDHGDAAHSDVPESIGA